MNIHLNELIFEESFRKVALKNLSFRDIDQEFLVLHSADSHGSEERNDLYYCYMKPYEGLFFRLTGISDEEDGALKVDEDRTGIEDIPYEEMAGGIVSKIVENGDLLSNRLIVDLSDEYYDGDEWKDLLATRRLVWLDEVRKAGNPDRIIVPFCGRPLELKLIRCENDAVLAEDTEGTRYLYGRNGDMMKYCQGE
ncbi:MAG: hypothetical protein K6F53_09625 [Lachnospiraceae bacterium]|nr:hypothetical protein [Lachnospiraceae bacterium]